MLRRWLVLVTLAVLVVGLSGCPALMLGSLGYESYEYEKTGLTGNADARRYSESNFAALPGRR
jgi:hypothetical protein